MFYIDKNREWDQKERESIIEEAMKRVMSRCYEYVKKEPIDPVVDSGVVKAKKAYDSARASNSGIMYLDKMNEKVYNNSWRRRENVNMKIESKMKVHFSEKERLNMLDDIPAENIINYLRNRREKEESLNF
jgi:hypothetical protein